VASRARAGATALACRLTNSTLELEYKLRNRERQEEIIQPNSDKSFLVARKASTVNLESVSKSTLSSCISLNHCKAECSPKASPTSTETVHGYVIVLARTKIPPSHEHKCQYLCGYDEKKKPRRYYIYIYLT